MIIDSPESLKEWLTTVLEPMCEADPTALAKYVIALVKKDKPISELRETCIDQLDVFLQQETKPFVELLFKTLDSKTYLTKPDVPAVVQSQPPPASAVEQPLPVPPVNNVTTNPVLTSSLPNSISLSPSSKVTERRSSQLDATIDGEDRDSKRLPRKTGGTSHSRSRSRSRSRNRSRSRSRSPPKQGLPPRIRTSIPDRDERDRRGPRRIYAEDDRRRRGGAMGRRHDRYNDYRSRDRQERIKRSRSRSKSPGRSRSRSKSKDRSRQRNDSTQKVQSPANQDHGDTDYRFGGISSSGQNSAPPAVAPVPPPAGTNNANSESRPPFPGRNTRRCRDYDEKGYCMRGDLCPYDHGADPVVVEEAHLPTMLAYGPGNPAVPPPSLPQGPGPRPQGPPPGPLPPLLGPMTHPRPPPPMQLMPPSNRPFLPLPDPYITEPYNPEAPAMDRMPPRIRPPFWGPRIGPGRGPGSRLMPQYPQAPRELINVPTIDDATMPDDLPNSNNRRVVPPQKRPSDEPQGPPMRIFRNMGNMGNVGNMAAKAVAKRRPFDFNRLGNRKFNLENAVLELRKIPHGLNSITQLNNHFSRFGKIVNLQVCYEGDPEAALIQFSSHAEAHAAYRSTEAVLNNRFIKVFWHNKDNGASSPADNNVATVQKASAKERLGLPVMKAPPEGSSPPPVDDGEKSSVIMATSGTLSKTVFNPSALKKSNMTSAPKPTKAQQVVTAQETIKKKQEEQRKEAIKINADLQKRKQELLYKQIQQQKLLIEKLEKNKGMPAMERGAIMKTLKVLQESIEKLKTELVLTTAAQNNHPKTKQEAQKEILDIEMELYNKQHQGVDTSHLRKKVAELKQEVRSCHEHSMHALYAQADEAEAMSLGLIDGKIPFGRGRGLVKRVARGGGVFRGRGRGMVSGARSLDHRPRKLQITGFEEQEKDEVIAHLNQYGEIENLEAEEGGLKLIITYRNRREAETAVQQGTKFKGRVLVMAWYSGSLRLHSREGDGLVDGIAGEDELLEPEAENEDLLLVDDDEEEDSEARSWRR